MRRPSVLTLLCLFGLNACGGASTSGKKHVDAAPQGPGYDYTAAWIFAIGSTDAPTQSECKKAFELVERDANCASRSCKAASDLAHDARATCKKQLEPAGVARLRELGDTFSARLAEGPDVCVKRAERWLRDGCGDDGACEPLAQRWATRCAASVNSPLVLAMLEGVIERSLKEPRRIKLDTRSCDYFEGEVRKLAACGQAFECEDALPKVDDLILRCGEGEKRALRPSEALTVQRIRLGAGKETPELALTDEPVGFGATPGLLGTDNGKLVILKVCEERPTDLASYLQARAQCGPGEVLAARIEKTGASRTLNLVKLPHTNDASFAAAYPGLRLPKEQETRDAAQLEAFSAALDKLDSEVGYTSATLKKLGEFVAALPLHLLEDPRLGAAVAKHDAAWTTLFRALGDTKVRAVTAKTTGLELVSMIKRGFALPLADVNAAGDVSWGALHPALTLATSARLPQAFQAYSDRIAKLERKVAKAKVAESEFAPLVVEHAQQADACGSARDKLRAANQRLSECTWATPACAESELTALRATAAEQTAVWLSARNRRALIGATLAAPAEPSACSTP